MSRSVVVAPFVVTSDGAIFVNATGLTNATDVESVVRAAQEDNRPVFIGVMLSPKEVVFAMDRLANAADEVAARIVGERRQRPHGTARCHRSCAAARSRSMTTSLP